MRIGIHQPYLFPYKGYFDLIRSVDKFVVYDDAKYMKGKYINRNHFPNLFTFRLAKHSDHALINECYFFDIQDDIKQFKRKTGLDGSRYLSIMKPTYNVSYNIALTLIALCDDLGINTPIYMSSTIPHGTFANGVVDMVKALGGDTYVNLPGGKDIYDQEMFGDIELEFLETAPNPSILCSEELHEYVH